MTACCLIAALTCLAAAEPATPLPLPFQDDFAAAKLDPAWMIDAAEGNSVTLEQNQIKIQARTNTYAHIERPLGHDFVRVSCAVKPGAGVSWCTSLFIYWGPGQWCQFGIIADGGGSAYVTEMNAGIPTERRLSRCPADEWQWLAIELGADCVRYLRSSDGKAWTPEYVSRRTGGANRTPSHVIFGKGYGKGAPPEPAPDLDNNYNNPGPMTTSYIRDVRIERLDWSNLRASDAERASWGGVNRDPVAEKELAGEADPTFESVARYFPAMKFPREAIGVKDHPVDIGVSWDGKLQLNNACSDPKATTAFFQVGESPEQFGGGKNRCRKRLLDGYLPVVIADWANDGLEYEQTAFGWSEGFSPDTPLFAYVRLIVKNATPASRKTSVRLVTQTKDQTRSLGEWPLSLDASGKQTIFVKVPYDIANSDKPLEVKADEFGTALVDVQRYWNGLLSMGERFSIPEQRVQDAYRAWLAYSFLNVDKRDGVFHICDGAGFYEEIYGYSAALYCHILDLTGYHDQARIYLDSLLTLQQPDGLFYVNFGHTDTGTLLHVMALHYQITRDADWLRRVAPNMVRMCDWIITHRSESMKHIHGKRAVVHGLIRFRPYCDHELPAFDYYSNAYLCTGMADTARVLAEIGMKDEAARLTKESEAYRQDILASMNAAVIDHEGAQLLPIMPDTLTLLKESQYTANGYYGLVASCLLEAGVLNADDPQAKLVVDALEQRGGLVAGTCQFFGQIDHAYTYGYWLNCLQRNEPRKAILGFYGSLAYGMTQETYAGVECTSIRTGENAHTLPHQYSCSKQLRLLRNMLLREEGDSLLIGQAIPRPWLAAGKQVEVKKAPTEFGPVSYTITSSENADRITVRLDPPTRTPPKTIRIWLRHPDLKPIQSLKVDPAIKLEQVGDSIQLASPAGPVTFDAIYAKK